MASKDQQITQLMEMGFGNNRVVRALQATAFKGVEAAMEWLLAHGEDTSLDEPFTEEEALQMKSNLEAPLEAAKKPLTEEEKAERLASGKDMGAIRQQIEEQEIKKMAEQRRREKQEEKAAKAKVLAQIEADKAARRAEREAAKNPAAAAAPPTH